MYVPIVMYGLRLFIVGLQELQCCLQVNSLNFKKGNIGMANMHKKQRRQDRDGLVMMAR